MIHTSSKKILAAVAFAILAVGCAIPAEGTDETSTASSDLTVDTRSAEHGRIDIGDSTKGTFDPKAVPTLAVNPAINGDHVLGAPADKNGPKPNPWAPAPDDNGDKTNTTNNTSGTSSSK